MTESSRALMPDYLRLVALFGIVVVNVQYIAFSSLHGIVDPGGITPADAVTLWLVNGLATLKTYGLFSFMFGVGLGFLMRSADRQGLAFGRIYRNRMLGLLFLGIAHGCLFFPGDILVIYAVVGTILYRVRSWPAGRLVRLGAALLLVQVVIAPPILLSIPDAPADMIAREREIITRGSFAEVVLFRAIGFAFALPVFLIVQGTAALGWFCLGLAAVKTGMIDNAAHPLWRRARRACLGPGLILSLGAAAAWQWGPGVAGAALTIAVAPIATLGYLGLIAATARPPGPLLSRALVAGGSSLSIYLGHSILLSTLFAGYGLGLWGAVDRATATGIALAVTLALICVVAIWRMRFSLGPFEWVLRRITHAGGARA
ncbi:DUF418 domain-containing protein [Salibaculum halophilum]|uniref:DUF418 domain-containing protein n=1 Tax=Salibaculum halophilum TaxID=1914408 RepID=UPI000A0F4AF0|nr:DUF418 domain-containing protein [Salibaculum halophilum]